MSEGEDCAWVDGVTWTPRSPVDTVVTIGGKSMTVPGTWLEQHSAVLTVSGGDTKSALASMAANGRRTVAECYALGIDPEKPDDDFKIVSFEMKDGKPVFTFSHTADGSGNNFTPRIRTLGKASLGDAAWAEVPEGGDPSLRFFKVEVLMP